MKHCKGCLKGICKGYSMGHGFAGAFGKVSGIKDMIYFWNHFLPQLKFYGIV
jgi:hypothetical protein